MQHTIIHPNKIRQVLFLVLLLLLGALLLQQLYGFLPALLGAITLYVICRKPMFQLVYKRKWKPGAAAALIMVLTLLIILVPIWVLVRMLTSKIAYAIEHSNELVAALQKLVQDLEYRTGYEILTPDTINKVSTFVAGAVPDILGATFNTLGTLFFMYFILYFMLANGKLMEQSLFDNLPMNRNNARQLGKEMKTIVFSNAVGIPGVAFLQGIVAIIGYYILGVNEPWFWFVITCISAMLPVVGAAFAFVPIALIFFANNEIWRGVAMLGYGFGIIGLVDNVFRLTLARKIGNVHPLVTIFGVILGIKLFGFVGLIFGPLLISLFMLLVRIYTNEFSVNNEAEEAT
jgi:predicted PurR-regulated permease PerM